jgi:hypothetical protein
MHFRQKVFLVIALITLCFIPFNEDYAVSVVPGWHTTYLYTSWKEPFLGFIYFLLIAIVYKFLPAGTIRTGYFWVHAFFSVFPMLYTTFAFSALFRKTYDMEALLLENKVRLGMDILFAVNQVAFLLIVFWKQSKLQPLQKN